MSGGSYDYLYRKVTDFADQMSTQTPERRAFAVLVRKVAKAMHDIEWVDSCDYAQGGEIESIMACIAPQDLLDASLKEAVHAKDNLEKAVQWALEMGKK